MMQVTIDHGAGTVTAEGHCGYAPAGADIVCAGASTLLDTYAKCLAESGQLAEDSVVDTGYVFLRDESCRSGSWLEFLVTGLQLLEEAYPYCVQVSIIS